MPPRTNRDTLEPRTLTREEALGLATFLASMILTRTKNQSGKSVIKMTNSERAKFNKATELTEMANTNRLVHQYTPPPHNVKYWDAQIKRTISKFYSAKKSNEMNPQGSCKNALRLLVKQVIFDQD